MSLFGAPPVAFVHIYIRTASIESLSRGSRVCVGMNIALSQLNTTLAMVVRRFDFKLFEADR